MLNGDLIPTPNRVRQRLTRAWLRLIRPVFLPRVRRPAMERRDGLVWACLPTVLNPVVFRTGTMLGQAAAQFGRPKGYQTALDMGCGSGVVGTYLAQAGYDVTSADINPDAVRLAKANALLNRLEDRITVVEGDLFEPLQGQRFDLVCFGPPYFKGQPKNDRLSRAFWSDGLMARFARELPDHLTEGGSALIHLSTDGDSEGFLTPAAEAGFDIKVFTRKHYGNEIMTVYLLTLPATQPTKDAP